MKGYIYTMFQGADPGKGWAMTDPIYGAKPTLGACMPNIRRAVDVGDYIFSISGRVKNVQQFIVGGFAVEQKLNSLAAREMFPDNILHKEKDGTLRGNIIVDHNLNRLKDDYHTNWEKRIDNYIVGTKPKFFQSQREIDEARKETLTILQDTFKRKGETVSDVIGRWRRLDEEQIHNLITWIEAVKMKSKR
ncbi:MAG: hypothetical protein RH948_14265 [Cyclobacteriaceae bacterium]